MMKVYESKSLEELRMEDYSANRKGPDVEIVKAETPDKVVSTLGGLFSATTSTEFAPKNGFETKTFTFGAKSAPCPPIPSTSNTINGNNKPSEPTQRTPEESGRKSENVITKNNLFGMPLTKLSFFSQLLSKPAPPPPLPRLSQNISSGNYNPIHFIMPTKARFFVIKSSSEKELIESFKNKAWKCSSYANFFSYQELMNAYNDVESEAVFLIFGVQGADHYNGIGKMTSELRYRYGVSDFGREFRLEWIFVKDIPITFTKMHGLEKYAPSIIQIHNVIGKGALKIFREYECRSSLLDRLNSSNQTETNSNGKTAENNAKNEEASNNNIFIVGTEPNPGLGSIAVSSNNENETVEEVENKSNDNPSMILNKDPKYSENDPGDIPESCEISVIDNSEKEDTTNGQDEKENESDEDENGDLTNATTPISADLNQKIFANMEKIRNFVQESHTGEASNNRSDELAKQSEELTLKNSVLEFQNQKLKKELGEEKAKSSNLEAEVAKVKKEHVEYVAIESMRNRQKLQERSENSSKMELKNETLLKELGQEKAKSSNLEFELSNVRKELIGNQDHTKIVSDLKAQKTILEEILAKKESAFVAKSEDLSKHSSTLFSEKLKLEQKLGEEKSKSSKLESEFSKAKNELINHHDNVVDDLKTENTQLKVKLAKKESSLEESTKYNKSLVAEKIRLLEEAGEEKSKLKSLESELAKSSNVIKNLEVQKIELERRLAEKESNIAKQSAERESNGNEQSEDFPQKCSALESQNRELQSKLEEEMAKSSNLSKLVDMLNQSQENLNSERTALEQELNEQIKAKSEFEMKFKLAKIKVENNAKGNDNKDNMPDVIQLVTEKTKLSNKIDKLEDDFKKMEAENIQLKEKISQLEENSAVNDDSGIVSPIQNKPN